MAPQRGQFQIQKQGPPGVIRRLLGIIGGTFDRGADHVQPVAEIRAVRIWEDFDEGIIRFGVNVAQAAVVGQNSMVSVTLDLAVVPSGTIYVIEEVDNRSAMTITARVGTVITPVATVAGVFGDQRMGPAAAPPPIVFTAGSNAAPGGSIFTALSAAVIKHDLFIGTGTLAFTQAFSIVGETQNTALGVTLRGRIILPR